MLRHCLVNKYNCLFNKSLTLEGERVKKVKQITDGLMHTHFFHHYKRVPTMTKLFFT